MVLNRTVVNDFINSHSIEEARKYCEDNALGLYYYSFQPGSEFSKTVKYVSSEIFPDCARIFLDIGGWRCWVPLIRKNGNWKLTMDERSLLEHLTVGWQRFSIGKVQYVSDERPSADNIREALKMNKCATRLEKIWGYKIEKFFFYIANCQENASNIIDEINPGAGKARFDTIKAVETAFHSHELVHLFALRIGFVNPFVDEGIANYLGSKPRIKDEDDIDELITLMESGYEQYLDGEQFFKEHVIRKANIYGLSQIVIGYWVKKFGFQRIIELLRKGVRKPGCMRNLIPTIIEPFKETNLQIMQILNRMKNDEAFLNDFFLKYDGPQKSHNE
jgi:hypothetical protein